MGCVLACDLAPPPWCGANSVALDLQSTEQKLLMTFEGDEDENFQPIVAVIGTGFLGQRIVTEMLLLGARVKVFDTNLAAAGLTHGQELLDRMVCTVLRQCAAAGLLELAGLCPPPLAGSAGAWQAREGEEPRQAQLCISIAEAATGAEVVIEAVPDSLEVKCEVFSEAMAVAPAALLATSTLTLPLMRLSLALAKDRRDPAPRVVGLRFLDPVCFMPIVEITLSSAQMGGPDRRDLVSLLHRLRKSAFQCTVQGCTGEGSSDGYDVGTDEEIKNAMRRSLRRLRILPASALHRQKREAKLRRVQQGGFRSARKLTTAQLFGCDEEKCCICMAASAAVTNVLCGHCVMCNGCAHLALQLHPICPICRCPFEPALKAQDHS